MEKEKKCDEGELIKKILNKEKTPHTKAGRRQQNIYISMVHKIINCS